MPNYVKKNDLIHPTDYTVQDMDNLAGMLQIDRYGTQNFLPPNISATFDGSTRRVLPRECALNIEPDGTLMVMRSATNGVTDGVFVSYLPITESGATGTYVPTTFQYKPAYLGNYTPITTGRHNEGVLLGQARNNSVYDDTVWYIALTGNTFDPSQHVGARLTGITVELSKFSIPVIVGTHVYIFTLYPTGIQFRVYRVSLADLRQNEIVTLEPVTGWTTTGLFNVTTGTTNIQICTTNYTTLPTTAAAADSLYQRDPATTTVLPWNNDHDVFAASDGVLVRILLGTAGHMSTSSATTYPYWANSIAIDLADKTALLEKSRGEPITIDSSSGKPIVTGSMLINRMKVSGRASGLTMGSGIDTVTGESYSTFTPNYGVAQISSSIINNFQSRYESLNINTRDLTVLRLDRMADIYGSMVGGELRAPRIFPGDQILTTGLYNNNGGASTGIVLSKYGTPVNGVNNPTYAYHLPDNSTVMGFPPNAQRKNISTAQGNALRWGISEIAADGSVRYNGAVLWEERLSAPIGYAADMSVSDPTVYGISLENLNAIGAQLLADIGQPYSSYKTVIYVPVNTNIPPICYISYQALDKSGTGYAVCDLSGARNANSIFTINVGSQINFGIRERISISLPNEPSDSFVTQGMVIYEGTDCWFVGWVPPYINRWSGGGGFTGVSMLVLKSSPGRLSGGTQAFYPTTTVNANTYSPPFALPGFGFGCINGPLNQVMSYTGIVFTLWGNSIADYTAKTTKADYVILSQIVPVGFYLYFTEPSPLLYKGKMYTLPVVGISFSPPPVQIDPDASRVHIWAVVNDGVAGYQITNGEEPANSIYVGYAVCGVDQITRISVNKVTRVAGYYLSTVRIGSAIPVSTGNSAPGEGASLWP